MQPFCSLIQIHGHNRARQRDKLGHILEEFATLQDEVSSRLHLNVFFLLLSSFCFAISHYREQTETLQPLNALCAPQAEKVDAALHSLLMKLEPQRQHLACLGTWILYHNLRIMIQYLLSGFELELYSMHEYYYIYW